MDSEEIEVIESESELQEPVVAKKSSKKTCRERIMFRGSSLARYLRSNSYSTGCN